ncbi:MAG: DNA-processing protein DprA [Candidatus Nomurabacteria bacterium]|nr:DNA-processing protein DprA [Candidatus Nomurabacteria bacterium]
MSKSNIPLPLQEIPDSPKRLFTRGTLPSLDDYVFLTVVGSRKYSNYGRDACEQLIAGLRGYPIVIVSGLALGMDSIAHRAALDNGLKTVAVPGSGLDDAVIYPATNLSLAHEIILNGGALLSEFESDTRAERWTFPRRNRIMAGLSRATLVVEATNKSGTRITAKLATEYNRDVLAVPGSIFSDGSSGTNELIKLGATPITSSADILQALGFNVTETTPDDAMLDCTEQERAVLSVLASPMPRGELIRQVGMNVGQVNVIIATLEIKGLIKETMGEVRRV